MKKQGETNLCVLCLSQNLAQRFGWLSELPQDKQQ